jgi:surface antigen
MKRFLVVAALSLIVGFAHAMECVEYCQNNGYSDISGDGYEWWGASATKGYIHAQVPAAGSVLVWKKWDTEYPGNSGHVAIVASLIDSDEISVDHANWPTSGSSGSRDNFELTPYLLPMENMGSFLFFRRLTVFSKSFKISLRGVSRAFCF